jgi:hypothetical protein
VGISEGALGFGCDHGCSSSRRGDTVRDVRICDGT